MVIQCPACGVRYSVSPNAIGASGRKVRCAKCAHQWFQAPAEEPLPADVQEPPAQNPQREAAAEPSEVGAERSAPTGFGEHGDAMPDFDAIIAKAGGGKVSVPVVVPSQQALQSLRRASLLVLVAGLLVGLYGFAPFLMQVGFLRPVYAWIGAVPTDGVQLKGMHVEVVETRRNTRFLISGTIVNAGDEARYVPNILITTTDSQQRPIGASPLLPSNDALLQPGEEIPFFKELKRSNQSVASIYIDLGSRYQLMHRE